MKATLCTGLFLSLLLVFDQELGDAPYAALLLTVGAVGVAYAIRYVDGGRSSVAFVYGRPHLGLADCLMSVMLLWSWLPIVLSWFVGALTGLANGAAPEHVLRNFFGLLSFALMPLLVLVGPSTPMVVRTVLLAGLCQCVIGFVVVVLFPPDLTQLFDATSISDLRTLYSAGFISIFPLLAVGLAVRWLLPGDAPERNSFLVGLAGRRSIVVLASLALIVPPMSKGFILATGALIVGMLGASAVYAARFRMSWWPILGALVLGVVILLSLPPEVRALIGFSFGSEESGNSVRAEQYDYLTDELSWFGAGLGSVLRSGYTRGEPPYGFELTYVNLVQKLGIWSLFLLATYVLGVLLAMWRMWRRQRVLEAAFSMGCFAYLIVGAANPLLLAPTAVAMHCIASFVLIRPYLVYIEYHLKPSHLRGGYER